MLTTPPPPPSASASAAAATESEGETKQSQNPISFFFSDRSEGVNESSPESAWRYGRGNCFVPPAAHPDFKAEQTNAAANIDSILAKHLAGTQLKHPGVILESQYGKGIWDITQDFLDRNSKKGTGESLISVDDNGRITLKGDGLFTILPNILLLNRSGDAHPIVLRSTGTVPAYGILVGSWHCVEKEIFDYMIEKFLSAGVQPNEIQIIIGPGLAPQSYSLGPDVFQSFAKQNPDFIEAFTLKPTKSKKDGKDKYLLDFAKFISIAAARFGIPKENLNTEHQANTFDKDAWKAVKAAGTVEGLTKFYEGQAHYGARMYSRVRRGVLKVDPASTAIPQPASAAGVYAETGRNLNGAFSWSPTVK